MTAVNGSGESGNSTQGSATPAASGGGTLPLNSWTLDTGAVASNLNTTSPSLGNGTASSAEGEAMSSPFAAFTLTNVGDSLTMSGTVAITLASTSVDQFRIGVFNHNAQTGIAGWLGYLGGDSEGASSGFLRERTNPNTGNYGSGTGAPTLNQPRATGNATMTTGTYTLSVQLTKSATNAMQVDYSISNGGTYVLSDSFTDTANANTTFTYDRVGIFLGGTMNASLLAFSNMQVVTSSSSGFAKKALASTSAAPVAAGSLATTSAKSPAETSSPSLTNSGASQAIIKLNSLDPTWLTSAVGFADLPSFGITTINGEKFLTMTYRQPAELSQITQLQVSPDLIAWKNVQPASIKQVDVDPSTGDAIMQITIPATDEQKFLRLKTAGL